MKIDINKLSVRIFGTIFNLSFALGGFVISLAGICLCATVIGAIIGFPLFIIGMYITIGCFICSLQALITGSLKNNIFEKINNKLQSANVQKVQKELNNYGPFTTFTVENNKYINN